MSAATLVRRRWPEVYAGYADAARTAAPSLRVAVRIGTSGYVIGYAARMARGRPAVCTCDPRHLEAGGYDRGCPRHDRPPGGAR